MGNPAEQHPSPKPTRIRFGVLGFAFSLSLITYLDRTCISRAASDMQNDLGLDLVQMGWIFSAFTLGYAVFEVPGALMGDWWGSRRVLTRIVLCWSLFTALTGAVWAFRLDSGRQLGWGDYAIPLVFDAFVALLLVRFFFGLGEAGAYPNLARVIRDWIPFQERARAQGGIWFSARMGGAIAPLVLGRMTVALGWRQAFWVLGVVGVVWAVAFWLWFRDRPEEMPACNEAERDLIHGPGRDPSSARDVSHPWPSWRLLASSLTMWAMCWASFWVCAGWYFYPTWQPKYLMDVHGYAYSDQWSEVLTGLPFFCGALGSLAGGGASDLLVRLTGSRRWGRSFVGLFGFTGAGVCVLLTGYATTATQAVFLLCAAFLINDLAIPVIWAACTDVGGRYAGTVSGLMNSIGAGGAILCPVLIPRVLTWLPDDWTAAERWRVVFASLAVAWFLSAAAWLFIDASRPLDGRREAEPQPPPAPSPRSPGVSPATGHRRDACVTEESVAR